LKLTRQTGYYSSRGEPIHEGDGFMYRNGNWIHMGKGFIYPKYFDPDRITGSAFYNKEKREWWIETLYHPDKNIRLKDLKGVTQKGEIYKPE